MNIAIIILIFVITILMIIFNMWFTIRSNKVLKFRKELREHIYNHYLKSEYSLSATLQMIDITNDPTRDLDAMIYSFKPLTYEQWLDEPELYILFPDKYPQYKSYI